MADKSIKYNKYAYPPYFINRAIKKSNYHNIEKHKTYRKKDWGGKLYNHDDRGRK